jgi:hypothetical protein
MNISHVKGDSSEEGSSKRKRKAQDEGEDKHGN